MVKKVLIIAAGTGGHIFPALAVAEVLKQQNIEVSWLGTFHGLEEQIVTQANIPFYQIRVSGLRGKDLKRWLKAPFQLTKAFLDSVRIIRRVNPDVVFAMGGFVCGPSGFAAKLLKKKIILHEQNAVAGLTNKSLANIADEILTGFPNVFPSQKKRPVIYTGNPIRAAIEKLPAPEERFKDRSGPIHLLVFGGSQGALSFNREVPKAIAQLPQEIRPLIWHQSGQQYVSMTKEAYQQGNIDAQVMPFIENMAEAYSWADLVICRSGAITVAELSAVGLAAILIPYPYHKDEQQKHNAEFLVTAGTAVLMNHQELMAGMLKATLSDLLPSREHLLDMAKAGRTLRKDNVAQAIVSAITR